MSVLLNIASCRFLAILLVLGLFSSASHGAVWQQDAADLVLFNGVVLTMNDLDPRAEAVAVRDSKIVAVGSNAAVLALSDRYTQKVNLHGLTLMPGFVDAHSHLLNDYELMGTDLRGGQELALSHGITTLGNMFAFEGFLAEMQALDMAGDLLVRTSLYLSITDNCGNPTGDWWQAYEVDREPGARLWISGLKAFADGGSCGRLAGSQELLPGYGLGDLFFNQEAMNGWFALADSMGYQLAVHAQGDRAIEQVLNAMQTVTVDGQNSLRHRIEHNAIVRPEQRGRYTETGAVATLVGFFPVCEMLPWTDFFKDYGEDARAMLDANPDGHFAWHGDDPWMPPISPLLEMASLVTRQEIMADGSVCEPPDWLKAKAITVQECLQLMTMGSAYALFREGEVGSLEVGKFADMVVISADPTAVPSRELWEIQLLMTLVGGDLVYCRDLSAEQVGPPDSNLTPKRLRELESAASRLCPTTF